MAMGSRFEVLLARSLRIRWLMTKAFGWKDKEKLKNEEKRQTTSLLESRGWNLPRLKIDEESSCLVWMYLLKPNFQPVVVT